MGYFLLSNSLSIQQRMPRKAEHEFLLSTCRETSGSSYIAVTCLVLSFVTGEIRCYCDAAHCVATGYMCKSELNACFSRLLDPQNTHSPLTHGCLDSLVSTSDICHAKQAQNHSGASIPTLECCHEDMCNYRGLNDVLSPSRGESSGKQNSCALCMGKLTYVVFSVC